jgi:RND superfamily putative drug exporter
MRLRSRLIGFITGRRTKWIVLALWLAIAAVSMPLAAKLNGVTTNDQRSSLPSGSQSARLVDQQARFPAVAVLPALVVYQRPGGLTASDKARIVRDAAQINGLRLPGVLTAIAGQTSSDGSTGILTVPIRAASDLNLTIRDATAISKAVGQGSGGLQIRTTGPAGFLADTVRVFSNINTKILLATVVIVAILLLITYRSPFLWLLPLLSVGLFADLPSRALAYLLASQAGLKVDGMAAGITIVLVFGAGTDYALLLISRYREELRLHEDRHAAMAAALRGAGPAILASGITVTIALLTLLLATLASNRSLGALAALGIALAMVAMLTALPALLLAVPRGIFWPLVPRFGSASREEAGFWSRLGTRLFKDGRNGRDGRDGRHGRHGRHGATRRTRTVAIVTTGVLGVMALGLVALNPNLSQLDIYRGKVQSVEGQKIIAQSFPRGVTAPAQVIVPATRLQAAMAAAGAVPGITDVLAQSAQTAGGLAQFQVVLGRDPYSSAAWTTITALRAAMKTAAGPGALVGGDTAQALDVHNAGVRDALVVAPLVLLIVFVVLCVLLRSLVAPLMLTATVMLSFGATVGFSVLVFKYLFGFPAIDAGTPLLAFVFLVALGVDYNIFLMTRVREEANVLGTRRGTLKALAVTGGVITSAGLVLAGTFSVLAALPLVVLTEFGFIIAFGVLLDTFLVRTVLVPALTLWIGRRVWWPGRLAREDEAAGPGQAVGTAASSREGAEG